MIKINNLNFKFGNNLILNNINLEIKKSKVNILVGPNGSGKTTFFRCLNDIYPVSKECIYYNNNDFYYSKNKLKPKLYFVSDQDSLDFNITGLEYLYFILDLYDKNKKDYQDKIKYFVELYDMQEDLDKLCKNYSHGMIKKIALIACFLISSDYIIMDEPFNGLDPEYSIITQKIIQEIAKKEKTIIVSSHNLNIVEKIADNLILIIEGSIIYQGNVQNYLEQSQSKTIENSWLELIHKNKKISYDLTKISHYI